MKLTKIFSNLALCFLLSAKWAFAQTDFWQQINGPDGGTVNMIAVNKSNGYVFAVVEGAGMMRSTDNGASWTPKNSGLTSSSVQTIAINAKGDIFAGTNGQGVFRSTDHGERWVQINTGIASTHRNIRALAVDSNNGNLFAGTSSSGLYRSSDNGNTWTPLPTGLTGAVTIQALALKPSSKVVFVGTDKSGVLRSTNNGDTWTPIDTSSIYKNVRALVVTASGAVFAGADSASAKRAILRSTDNGESWAQVLAPSCSVVWFALNSSDHIWAGTAGCGIYVSSDNGGNWSLRNNGLRGYAISTIAFNASDHIFAGAHCAGVFRSTDNGASWQAMNKGLTYTNILSLAVNQSTGRIVAGTHCGGVFCSSDNGDNWAWAGLPGAQVTALAVNSNGRFFAGVARLYLTETGGDIYYADDCITWTKVTPDNDAYFSFAINSAGHIYAGTGFYQLCGIINVCDYGDIYRSTNNGGSWSKVASKLDDFVYTLAVNPSGRVFAGTGEGVYRSRNEFWDKLNSYNTRSLVIDPLDPNIILDGTSGGIWRSSDGGDSWTLVRSMPNNFTWTLVAQPTGEILAGTQRDGVLKSNDAGMTWTPLNTGLTNNDVRLLAIYHANKKIFAVTNGGGIFRGELSPPPQAGIKPVVAATQSIGAEFWTDLAVSEARNLFGVSFDLSYTNTVYVDAVQTEAGSFLGNDLVFLPAIDDANGKVSIGISRKAGQGGVSGSGVIARVKFKSLATTPSGTQVTFSLSSVSANDPNGEPISLTTSNAATTLQGLGVWPGDTNNDGVVNAADVLPIGVYWNKTGPARQKSSCDWIGQPALSWTPEVATYADANGDGMINQADVLCIGLNWSRIHALGALITAKTDHAPALRQGDVASLFNVVNGNTNPDQEFWIEVSVDQVTNLFGISFELLYTPVTLADPQATEAGSFIGNDVLYFPYIDKNSGKVSFGITRKAGQGGVSGSGVVARIKMKVSSQAVKGQVIMLTLQNVTANDPAGQQIPLRVIDKLNVIVSVKSKPSASLPEAFALHGAAPNPFNPSTTIKYDLPQAVDVTLVIFDMLGRRVRTLVDQHQPAGRYAITWNGRNEQGQVVTSGTFLYQLRAGNFVQTRRMALVR